MNPQKHQVLSGEDYHVASLRTSSMDAHRGSTRGFSAAANSLSATTISTAAPHHHSWYPEASFGSLPPPDAACLYTYIDYMQNSQPAGRMATSTTSTYADQQPSRRRAARQVIQSTDHQLSRRAAPAAAAVEPYTSTNKSSPTYTTFESTSHIVSYTADWVGTIDQGVYNELQIVSDEDTHIPEEQ